MSSPKMSPHWLNGLLLSDDHGGAFVAVGDQAEHEAGGFGIERDVSDLVDHQQRDERQSSQLGFEVVLAFGLREPGDPFGGGRELHALAGEARADREGDREVCFAGAGRSEEDHVLFAVQEVELPEMLNDRLLDAALEGEVELLQRFAGGEPGGLDPPLAAV